MPTQYNVNEREEFLTRSDKMEGQGVEVVNISGGGKSTFNDMPPGQWFEAFRDGAVWIKVSNSDSFCPSRGFLEKNTPCGCLHRLIDRSRVKITIS